MRIEQLRKAQQRAPFKPFTIFVSDQRRFEIRHSEYMWIIPGGRIVGIADDQGVVDLIDLVHITGVKFNGTKKGDA